MENILENIIKKMWRFDSTLQSEAGKCCIREELDQIEFQVQTFFGAEMFL
jgi:hypothetical protein